MKIMNEHGKCWCWQRAIFPDDADNEFDGGDDDDDHHHHHDHHEFWWKFIDFSRRIWWWMIFTYIISDCDIWRIKEVTNPLITVNEPTAKWRVRCETYFDWICLLTLGDTTRVDPMWVLLHLVCQMPLVSNHPKSRGQSQHHHFSLESMAISGSDLLEVPTIHHINV